MTGTSALVAIVSVVGPAGYGGLLFPTARITGIAEGGSVLAPDLNSDGVPDLVRVTSAGLEVFIAADGGFASPKVFPPGGLNESRTGDLNGDGLPDIVGILDGKGRITVVVGDGDAGLALLGQFELECPWAIQLALADFDGDGDLDAMVVYPRNVCDQIDLFLNDGSGALSARETAFTGLSAHRLACGDIDADGLVDVVIGDKMGNVTAYKNDGALSFVPMWSAAFSQSPVAIAELRDFDADGDFDIAATHANGTSFLANDGAGQFTEAQLLPAGRADRVVALDWDGDGDDDLVTGGPMVAGVAFENNGAGSFVASDFHWGFVPSVFVPSAMAVADLNLDGSEDLIINSKDDARLHLSIGTTSSSGAEVFVVGPDPNGIAFADLSGDGAAALIAAVSGNDTLQVLRNIGGSYELAEVIPIASEGPASVVAADFDQDGSLDIACANYFDGTITVLSERAGVLAPIADFQVGQLPLSITAADMNGDGFPDLLATLVGDNAIAIAMNLSGSFAQVDTLTVGEAPISVIAPDLDADGDPDIASADTTSNTCTVLENVGNGEFIGGEPFPIGTGPSAVAAGDLDMDGDLDLVISLRFDDTVAILHNDGAGGFVLTPPIPVGDEPFSVLIHDLDHNGHNDILVANSAGEDLSFLRADGLGGYVEERYGVGEGCTSLVSRDVDDDGDLDVALVNFDDDTAFILRNLTNPTSPNPDLDGSGAVDSTDLNILLWSFGCSPPRTCEADVDGDGDVDSADLEIVLMLFGNSVP